MKQSLIFVALVFWPFMTSASVENIQSMQKNAAGSFDVNCEDGTQQNAVSADNLRADIICEKAATNDTLLEGLYSTNSSFCGQTLKWVNGLLEIELSSPCAGHLKMENYQPGWYRGKVEGYEYLYEVKVTGADEYTFYSRSFATQGDFKKASGQLVSPKLNRRHTADPAMN